MAKSPHWLWRGKEETRCDSAAFNHLKISMLCILSKVLFNYFFPTSARIDDIEHSYQSKKTAIIIQLQWLLMKLLTHKNTCKKPEACLFYHGMALEGKAHVCWILLNKNIFYQQHEIKIL